MQQHLSKEEFFREMHSREGLIPISIDPDNQKIIWLDMERYHFYEGFFHKSLKIFSALKKNQTVSFSTDLDILKDEGILTDYIYPTGFIFHAGRCGSTLLAKALARTQENLVLSEAGPLNQILHTLTKGGTVVPETNDVNRMIYRNLVLLLARHRVATHKYLFIKFTSFNILFFNFIHSVFPDVPAIFLTRDIDEIIQSMNKKYPAWLKDENFAFLKIATRTDRSDTRQIIQDFLDVANKQSALVLNKIDYTMLRADNLPFILSCLNHKMDEKQMSIMKTQFLFDSKEEFNRKVFKEE